MDSRFKKVTSKEIKEKSELKQEFKSEFRKDINIHQILTQKYPDTGEDYALQLWQYYLYKT